MNGPIKTQEIIERANQNIADNVAFIEQAAGIVGVVTVGLAVGYVVISILIELVEIIFLFTPSKKDDDWIAKVRVKWSKLKPYMKWVTVKTPLSKILNKALKILRTIKGAIIAMRQKRIEKKVEALEREKTKLESVKHKAKRQHMDAKIIRLTKRLKNLK